MSPPDSVRSCGCPRMAYMDELQGARYAGQQQKERLEAQEVDMAAVQRAGSAALR
jgi:hypothetical protein